MVLTASEARKQARESLKGKWGIVVLITLIFMAYSFLAGLLSAIPFIGFLVAIAEIVIDVPILYGFTMSMMKLKRGETVGYFDFFQDGFANFKRAWCVAGRLLSKMIAPLILVVIAIVILVVSLFASLASAIYSGSIGSAVVGASALTIIAYIVVLVAYIWLFIKALTYGLGIYLAIDNPDTKPLDCVNKSKELMDENKGRLFCLYLSFIGWFALTVVLSLIPVVGVIVPFAACLVLVPYVQFATIVFYENRAGIDSSATVAEGSVSSANGEDDTAKKTETAKVTEIKEQSGSKDVKAEIVDIPNMDQDKD